MSSSTFFKKSEVIKSLMFSLGAIFSAVAGSSTVVVVGLEDVIHPEVPEVEVVRLPDNVLVVVKEVDVVGLMVEVVVKVGDVKQVG